MININNWKYFYISKLFDIEPCKCSNASLLLCQGRDIEYIGAKKDDCGFMNWVKYDKELVTKGNCIIFICDGQGSVGYTNYIDHDFIGSTTLSVGRNPKLNMYNGLFLVTVLDQERFRYSFGRKYKTQIANTKIKLPATPDGKPDWQYMEDFTKSIIKKRLPHNALSTKNVPHALKSHPETWKDFALPAIFERFEIGKAKNDILDEGNDCLYLGAKKEDNCVMRHCAYNPALAHQGNCIIFICNGEGSVGYANYMDRPFIATTDLVMGYSKHLNKYNGLFIATVLDKERPKYSFGRKWKTHLKDTVIKLPATKTGKPDWKYMENYIKSLPYGDRI